MNVTLRSAKRLRRVRWLYHIRLVMQAPTWPWAPASLATEGFVHASFRDAVVESARLYFPADAKLEVLRIDPRKLAARVEIALTPRGEMPHIFGKIEESVVNDIVPLADFDARREPDRID